MKIIHILIALLLISIPATATTISTWGDSITAGNVGSYSYRNELYNQLNINNYDFDFVGTRITTGDKVPDKQHEGYPGKRIDYFITNANYILSKNKPDIIIIHLGTNDIFNNQATTGYLLSTAPDRLGQLIDKIAIASPKTRIYVASIVPQKDYILTSRNEYFQTIEFNSKIPAIITEKQFYGINASFIDMFNEADLSLTTDYSLWDRLHPKVSGMNKMGIVYFNHIKNNVAKISNESLIRNSEFNSLEGWTFYTNGKGSMSINNGYSIIKINTTATNVQLNTENIILSPYTKYRLSFDAYSNTGHDVSFRLFKQVYPYTAYSNSYVANLENSWQNYTIEFTTKGFTSIIKDGKLMFWLAPYAKTGDIYYIDNVNLTRI